MPNNSDINSSTVINYPLLAVNAGIIGSIFIFFGIASQAPASTIFGLDTQKCSFGFNLTGPHTQIAISMVGGVLILQFSISSILTLIRSDKWSGIASSIGFALMFVAAIVILLSLSCRIPFDFFAGMIVTPSVITVAIIVGLHMYYEKKKKKDKQGRLKNCG
jgi:hypothetical protein